MTSGPQPTREGIAAQFVGRTGAVPRARFYPTGELVWEFTVRVVDTWDPAGRVETVTCRAPDQNYGALQNWVKPGALVFVRGWLTLARWQADGKDKARVVIDCVELMPVPATARGSEPAAMDYRGRVTMPSTPEESPKMTQAQVVESVSSLKKKPSRKARADVVRRMLEEAQ